MDEIETVKFQLKNIQNIKQQNLNIKEIVCPICSYISIDPLNCNQCFNTFCSLCLKDTYNSTKECPYKCPTALSPIINYFISQYKDLKLICPQCNDTVTYPEIASHACKTKIFAPTENFTMLEKPTKNKKVLLKGQKVQCNFCLRLVLYEDFEFHLKLDCALSTVSVKCEYCSRLFNQDQIKSHFDTCEDKILNSCPVCGHFNDNKIQLNKHILLCRNDLNAANLLFSSKNNDFSKRIMNLNSEIFDNIIDLNSNNPLFLEDRQLELNQNLREISHLLIDYYKSFEPTFCRRCDFIMKIKDSVDCFSCKKLNCCECSVVCEKCEHIFDKDCLKECNFCLKSICYSCDNQSKFLCQCGEYKICSNCIQKQNKFPNFFHQCRYLQILETKIYVVKIPKIFNNFRIFFTNEKNESLELIFLDDSLKNYSFQINITNKEIMEFNTINENLRNEKYSIILQNFQRLNYFVLKFNNSLNIDQIRKIIPKKLFNKKLENHLTYPIGDVVFN